MGPFPEEHVGEHSNPSNMRSDSPIPLYETPSAPSSILGAMKIRGGTLLSITIRKESAVDPDLVFIIFSTENLSIPFTTTSPSNGQVYKLMVNSECKLQCF